MRPQCPPLSPGHADATPVALDASTVVPSLACLQGSRPIIPRGSSSAAWMALRPRTSHGWRPTGVARRRHGPARKSLKPYPAGCDDGQDSGAHHPWVRPPHGLGRSAGGGWARSGLRVVRGCETEPRVAATRSPRGRPLLLSTAKLRSLGPGSGAIETCLP